MDYQPPTLCVRAIIDTMDENRFLLDMPSLWTDDGPVEVSRETLDYITVSPYQVPMCPPNYPNPPENNDPTPITPVGDISKLRSFRF